MWSTMECGDEVKFGPNNSIDSDCTSAKMTRPSIFKHLAVPTGGGRLQSSRWSPTAEQLMMLEELYKHGTRTPTALQIQEITTKLRRFGKIEGKNVFYWFQNHKARDKKKQRLRLEAQRRLFDHHHKQPVITKVTSLEAQQTKPEPLSNCSTISEECLSAVGRATTHSRVCKDETSPFCFPMINLNGTRPKTIISLLDTPHHDHHRDYTPRLSDVFSNIFGNYNDYGMIRETLNLFPLQSGNLKAVSQSQTSVRHEDAMPFMGDLSLSSLLAPPGDMIK